MAAITITEMHRVCKCPVVGESWPRLKWGKKKPLGIDLPPCI